MKRIPESLAIGTLFFVVVVASAQTATEYDSLVQKGKTQLQAGSADLALASGEEAIKMNADRWEGYALAGGALMNLKRYEDAADKFSHAIDRAPDGKQSALRDLRRQCLLAESGASPAPKESTSATTTQAEIVLWKSIENSTNPSDFSAYLKQYPQGAFAVLATSRLNQTEQRTAQQQQQQAAQQTTALQNSGLAGATATVSNGKTIVHLSTGDVWLDTFEGQEALSFPADFYCRSVGVLGQVGYCASGRIYVTNQQVAFQASDGKTELLSQRSATLIKSEGGREGDTFSIYDGQGKRHRYGTDKFDSPLVVFLQTAMREFPAAYKQVEHLAAREQNQ